MSRHTTWRVGGTAECYFQPADLDDLACFLESLPPEQAVYWVGLGSNLLVRDGGIRGTVISTSGVLGGLEQLEDRKVRAEAGVSCAKVARFCARNGLTGSEFLAGIPGTMGGALAMNAGAFGGETWNLVNAVETIDRQGKRRLRQSDEYEVGYRQVRGPEQEWFTAAHLCLEPGDASTGQAHIRDLLARRGETQPTQQASCGSVFRNPAGDHAARLIETCGMKGSCIGGACVSEKHANFIVNRGTATAADIEALIRKVVVVVEQTHGVILETEVRIIGEQADDRGSNAFGSSVD